MHGQCQPSAPLAKALQALPSQAVGPALRRTQGLAYLDIHCTEEARAAFQQELDEASHVAPDQQAYQTNLAKILLDLTTAVADWHNGNLKDAKDLFTRLSDPGLPAFVNSRAIFALAELLTQSPDSSTWAQLEPKLKILDEERGLWIARRYRLMYGLTTDNNQTRIGLVETMLRKDLSSRERLENQIILATLMRKAGRLMEARLLTADIESDVGAEAVSPDLRVAYVRECAAIASEEARHGDTEAAARYQRYLLALGEMYAPH